VVAEAISTARAAGAPARSWSAATAVRHRPGRQRLSEGPELGSPPCWPKTLPWRRRSRRPPRPPGVRPSTPGAVIDPDTGELISDAEVAEIEFTAFASTPTPVTARLIVRWVRDPRLARPQRRPVLRLPEHWPWAEPWKTLWAMATSPPSAAWQRPRPQARSGTRKAGQTSRTPLPNAT